MAQNAEDIDTPRYYFFMLAISALERRVPKKIVIRENLFGKYDACPYCGVLSAVIMISDAAAIAVKR